MIYIVAFILCSLFVAIYDFRPTKKGKWFCYVLLCFFIICISGFRYKVGGDTIRYMESFHRIHILKGITMQNMMGEGIMPLCYLFFSTCRTISDNFFFLQFVHAAIINIVIFTFIKKNTPFVFCSVLIYLLWSYLEFNTEIIRESLAVCTFLCGFRFLKKKKWLPYYIFCILALGFHISAIMTFVIPFVYYIRLNWKIIVVCLAFITLSTTVYELAPDYLSYLDLLGGDSTLMEARYFSNELEMRNWHSQVLYILKWVVFPICSFVLIRKGNFKDLYPYFGCIAAMIVLSSFSRYSYAFYRLNNYFMPSIWIMTGLAMRSLPTVFKHFSRLVFTHIISYILFAFICIYADYFITDREDMLKYFPYSSTFNKKEVYRPEW